MSVSAFEFATATRIVFGPGRVTEAGSLAAALGRRALLVIGQSAGAVKRVEPLLRGLTAAGVDSATFSVSGEPTIDTARAGAARARTEQCDLVIGFGGGSVIDAGKAVAALLTNEGDPLDYLEVIGKGMPLVNRAAPYLAIPTTAGTGAEVTRNAVLGSPAHRVKVSMRSPSMLPAVALVDPELTHDLPPSLTAVTGLDALTQCIEPYLSHSANPLTDAICREGMQRAARSLRRAFDNGADTAAREDMAVASLCGGLALANAKLGAVHGFAGPIGGMYDAPHGAVCAALLAPVLAVNEKAVASRRGAGLARQRFSEVHEMVGDLAVLVRALGIPSLRTYGIPETDFPLIIEKAGRASSMKGNPVELSEAELREVLQRAW